VPVVNISLSGEPNLLMEAAVHRAAERGTILIAAAGNNGPSAPPAYPGAYSGVIAVTAVDQNASVFHDANQGSYIAFAAPGVRVWIPGGGSFGQYLTGTSFAAPFVAAAATLAVADERYASPDQLSRELAAHSRHLGSPGRNPIYGYGLITAVSTCRTSAASAE
jgi:subtilisin family serine protease